MRYSFSKKLIRNVGNFLSIKQLTPFFPKKRFEKNDVIVGWGRKASGQKAVLIAKQYKIHFNLLEDGFIRSLGLGVDNSPSFSLILDSRGIYYDATETSDLEQILLKYDFHADPNLMEKANFAISLIKKYHISKYNHAPDVLFDYFSDNAEKRILVIAQTKEDASLVYGFGQIFTTIEMIDAAIKENIGAEIYLKIHPDVLSGRKVSDIDLDLLEGRCKIIDKDFNPISLIKYFTKVYTKTSQMGFEALLLGKKCVCFGVPFYAGWGVTDDRIAIQRRNRILKVEEIFAAAYILYTRYYNPYTNKTSDIIDTIQTIQKYNYQNLTINEKVYCFGFSMWKHNYIKPYFKHIKELEFINLFFSKNYLKKALRRGLDLHSQIYIWGKKDFKEIEQYATKNNIAITRVEDGFIRSVNLGSDLTKPYSIVIDSRGIYYDPTNESDLEHMLNNYYFDEQILQRARNLQNYLLKKKISKYNMDKDRQLVIEPLKKGQKIILVPGQVEDDASIIYGANGMKNLELLQAVRKKSPNAYIIYKPHPDVLVGNRKGNLIEEEALNYCNMVVHQISIHSILERVDEVHTMTSLVGFEALIRGQTVYTYGIPFYAGWGLTIDEKIPFRPRRKRTIEELIAATLILYPKYIHPKTNELCEVEAILLEIDKGKKRYHTDLIYKFLIDIRNIISRKTQFVLRVFLGEQNW